jgi:predicted nuclease with TOPRIM domain
MAFTCRPEEHHELTLQRICKKHDYKTKQKALFHLIEHFEQVEADRQALTARVHELETELSALQQAVRRKIEADENLARCINGR